MRSWSVRPARAPPTHAFPQLRLCGTRSAFRLDPDTLRRDGIDLILSTVDLDIKFRCIRISPILTERDKMILDTVLPAVLQQKARQDTPAPHPAPLSRNEAEAVFRLSQELLELVDHIALSPVQPAHSRAELIALSARLFAPDEITADIIGSLLRERDALGDTYIKPFRALLLQTRTECVRHCRLGYVRLASPLYEEGRVISGAVVMLIPPEDDLTCQNLMRDVSALLLGHPELVEHMRQGNRSELTAALTSRLLPCYRRRIRNLLGG